MEKVEPFDPGLQIMPDYLERSAEPDYLNLGLQKGLGQRSRLGNVLLNVLPRELLDMRDVELHGPLVFDQEQDLAWLFISVLQNFPRFSGTRCEQDFSYLNVTHIAMSFVIPANFHQVYVQKRVRRTDHTLLRRWVVDSGWTWLSRQCIVQTEKSSESVRLELNMSSRR